MMDGNLNIERDPESGDMLYAPATIEQTPSADQDHLANLAKDMADTTLDSLSDMLTENVAMDEDGRAAWEEQQVSIHEMLGLSLDGTPDTEDEICDTSDHPLLLTALLRFQAKSLSALLPSDIAAVNTRPVQNLEDIEDPEERKQAEEDLTRVQRRVGRFYAEYLFERLPAYEEETDMILHDMGLVGVGLRKIVVDRTRRNTPVIPEYVSPSDLIVGFNTRTFRAGRYTHRMNLQTGDIIRRIQEGVYRSVRLHDHDQPDLGPLNTARNAIYGYSDSGLHQSETHRTYEVYSDLYLKDDQHSLMLPRPYVVTVHAASRKILSIQRNWLEPDPDETPIEHFVPYIYHPGRTAIMGIGLGQILGNITKALRKAQRRSLESAYLQNHASGFKLSSLSIRDGDTRVRAGEFVDVDSPVNDIRAAIMPHMFQGPSEGLMVLAGKLEEQGQQLGGIASIDFAALMKSGVAVAPAMAAFEESTEFQTSVHRRLYKAHRKELQLIHDRMRSVIGQNTVPFSRGAEALHAGDLIKADILPFMKPGQASRQKVVLEAQALYETATAHPDMMDVREALKNYIRAMNSTDGMEMMLPDPAEEQPQPLDPVTEYANALAQKPIAAGPAQDHASHIKAHAAQLKLVETSQLPVDVGEQVIAAIGAHIAEHMAMMLAAMVSAQTGVPLEEMGPETPPEVEQEIAPMLAEAIAAFEEQNRPPEQGGGEADAKLMLQQMKQEHEVQMAELKKQHAMELQRAKDDAAMSRELEDNAAAILIAQMKGGAKTATADAGAGAAAGTKAVGNASA
jgi:hypothetical protein